MRAPHLALAGLVSLVCWAPALADGSPWLPEPDTGAISFSYVRQSADEKWTNGGNDMGGTFKGPMPGGELVQGTMWIAADYALRDNVALDGRIGWANSELGSDMDSGMADSTFGLTWRLADELIGQPVSFAVRGGAILAGNYDTGTALPNTSGGPPGIYAIGDGGSGFEASAIVGKVFADRVGVSVELGYRNRGNDIPANTFYNLAALLLVNERVTLAMDYQRINSDGDLDIGDMDFNPDRFPEVAEEASVIGGRASFNLTDSMSATVFYGDTTDGRNTSASGIVGVSLNYSFTTFGE